MTINLKRLELILWAIVPAGITSLMFILCVIPKHIWGISYIMPLLPLIPIFYWGIMQATEMPYWFVFLIGLLMDVVSGIPLGLSALLYVLFLITIHTQSKYIHKEGFVIIWGYFMMLLAIIFILEWLIISFSGNQMQAIPAAIIQWLLTISFYPIFHRLFDNVSEHIKQRRWLLGSIDRYL
jgi:rod shape-determining protein MreD